MPHPSIHTIVVRDARSGERGLLVEIHAREPEDLNGPSEAEIRNFEERLFNAGIRVGLYVTPSKFLVLRDKLSSMTFASNQFERSFLETKVLLDRAGANISRSRELHDHIYAFLKILPDFWTQSLPRDAIKAMVPDVIGQLFQAELEMFDGNYSDIAASA